LGGDNKKSVTLRIIGNKDDYWFYTVKSWLYEIKDILEDEYNITIQIKEECKDLELPVVYVNEELAFIGVPGEEGYLIEILKKVLDKVIKERAG